MIGLKAWSHNQRPQLCKTYYKNEIPTIQEKIDPLYTCSLMWSEKQKNYAIELLYLKNHCSQMEEMPPVDCMIIRTCPESSQQYPINGLIIFMDDLHKGKGLCTINPDGTKEILNLNGDYNFGALVTCSNGIPQSLQLYGPNNVRANCSLSLPHIKKK